jgi:hypothetical protein
MLPALATYQNLPEYTAFVVAVKQGGKLKLAIQQRDSHKQTASLSRNSENDKPRRYLVTQGFVSIQVQSAIDDGFDW